MANGELTKARTEVESEVPVVLEEGPSVLDVMTPEFLAAFQEKVDNYKKWLSVVYHLTQETHWINHGTEEKPKLSIQGPGAEAVALAVGINWDSPTVKRLDKTDDKGKYYQYWVDGILVWPKFGRKVYTVGYCDSRDQFFNARPGWTPETGEGDVQKSALTNWIARGVSIILGMRNPDPTILKQAGLDLTRIPRADYSGRKTPEADSSKISEAQGKRLWAICKSHNVPEIALKAYLSEKFQTLHSNDILRKDYEAICKWAEDYKVDRNPGQEG